METIRCSVVDTDRFGMRIFRGSLENVDPEAILSTILKEHVDVAILRFPSENQHQLNSLDMVGIPYIVADTLVYYQADLRRCSVKNLRNDDLSFVQCTTRHEETLNSLVEEIFVGYTTHYYSNPLLAKDKIVEGYKEWARSYTGEQSEGRIAWVVERSGRAIAFVTCRFAGDESEIILNGVKRSESGKGVYGDIIRFTQGHFKSMGCSTLKISTQVQNYAVQKVWAQNEFFLQRSYVTVHINSLLGISNDDVARINVRLSGNGDQVHGNTNWLCAIEEVGKHVYSVYAGFPAEPFSYKYLSLRPLSLERTYACHFSRLVQGGGDLFKSVVRFVGSDGNVYGLAYLDLYRSGSWRTHENTI